MTKCECCHEEYEGEPQVGKILMDRKDIIRENLEDQIVHNPNKGSFYLLVQLKMCEECFRGSKGE